MAKHRGRFQAQGAYLEKSESWAQQNPLLYVEGLELLDKLEEKLSFAERQVRRHSFRKCRKAMLEAARNGGINISDMGKVFIKSFPGDQKERVDLEVHLGIAFITKKSDDKDS